MQDRKPNYYEVLGLNPQIGSTYSSTDIKNAYKKEAKKLHPDKNINDTAATQKFQLLQEAYEILSNPEKRESYDNPSKKKDIGFGIFNERKYEAPRFTAEEKSFYDRLIIHMKDWPQPLREATQKLLDKNDSQLELIKNLFKLIINKKLNLNDFITLPDTIILAIVTNVDFVEWICGDAERPTTLTLLTEFSRREENESKEKREEKNSSSQSSKTNKNEFNFRLYMAAKVLNDDHFLIDKKDSFPHDLKRKSIYKLTFKPSFNKNIKKLFYYFENGFSAKYFQDIEDCLIKPVQVKVALLKAENSKISLDKSQELEKMINGLYKNFFLILISDFDRSFFGFGDFFTFLQDIDNARYHDNPELQPIHNGTIHIIESFTEASIIDKPTQPYKHNARIIVGIIIVIATLGFALLSSKFFRWFFYTDTRAVLDQAIEQLRKTCNASRSKKQLMKERKMRLINPGLKIIAGFVTGLRWAIIYTGLPLVGAIRLPLEWIFFPGNSPFLKNERCTWKEKLTFIILVILLLPLVCLLGAIDNLHSYVSNKRAEKTKYNSYERLSLNLNALFKKRLNRTILLASSVALLTALFAAFPPAGLAPLIGTGGTWATMLGLGSASKSLFIFLIASAASAITASISYLSHKIKYFLISRRNYHENGYVRNKQNMLTDSDLKKEGKQLYVSSHLFIKLQSDKMKCQDKPKLIYRKTDNSLDIAEEKLDEPSISTQEVESLTDYELLRGPRRIGLFSVAPEREIEELRHRTYKKPFNSSVI